MLSLPIPFVSALLLLLLALQAWRLGRGQVNAWGSWVFFVACAVLSLAVGIRWAAPQPWSDGIKILLPLLLIGVGPLAWICFAPANLGQSAHTGWRRWALAWPVLLLSVLLLQSRTHTWAIWGVNAMLLVVPGWFGWRLIRLSRQGSLAFVQARIEDAEALAQRARLAGWSLLVSAMVDVVVVLDFAVWRGVHAATVVAGVHVLWWPVLTWVLIRTAAMPTELPMAQPEHYKEADKADFSEIVPSAVPSPEAADRPAPRGDAQLLVQVQTWLDSTQAYRDPDLTLERMARKLGTPARTISSAINDHAGCNLSQWINGHRIAAAQVQLRDSDATVQQVMEDSGFLTKSNFYREFRRVVGLTPAEYRAKQRAVVKGGTDFVPKSD